MNVVAVADEEGDCEKDDGDEADIESGSIEDFVFHVFEPPPFRLTGWRAKRIFLPRPVLRTRLVIAMTVNNTGELGIDRTVSA